MKFKLIIISVIISFFLQNKGINAQVQAGYSFTGYFDGACSDGGASKCTAYPVCEYPNTLNEL
jgi:hypothetical protein